jgi:hypothetical protein
MSNAQWAKNSFNKPILKILPFKKWINICHKYSSSKKKKKKKGCKKKSQCEYGIGLDKRLWPRVINARQLWATSRDIIMGSDLPRKSTG